MCIELILHVSIGCSHRSIKHTVLIFFSNIHISFDVGSIKEISIKSEKNNYFIIVLDIIGKLSLPCIWYGVVFGRLRDDAGNIVSMKVSG